MIEDTRKKIQKRIEELKHRMNYDANDLEYETHLHLMRDLQRILNNASDTSKKRKTIINTADKNEIQPHVGHINFLNCLPLTYSLLKCGYHKGMSLVLAVPSSLNKLMLEHQLDISPMSSFAFAGMSDSLLMLPNLGIVSDGEVQSIILVSKKPINELNNEKIFLTAQSATSHRLLKIILKRAYKCVPQYEVKNVEPAKLFTDNETADLLIGDYALYANHNRIAGVYYYDIGTEWKKMTGMPMVYAVWAVTRRFAQEYPEELEHVYSRLRGGFDNGIADKDKMIEMVLQQKPFSRSQLASYFNIIKYDVGSSQLEALRTFYKLAYEEGLLPDMPDIQMAAVASDSNA